MAVLASTIPDAPGVGYGQEMLRQPATRRPGVVSRFDARAPDNQRFLVPDPDGSATLQPNSPQYPVGATHGRPQTTRPDRLQATGHRPHVDGLPAQSGDPDAPYHPSTGASIHPVMPLRVLVPDITGMPLKKAKATLLDRLLRLGSVSPRFDATQPGIVLRQSKPAGQPARPGESVDVHVSRRWPGAQDGEHVPGLTGRTEDPDFRPPGARPHPTEPTPSLGTPEGSRVEGGPGPSGARKRTPKQSNTRPDTDRKPALPPSNKVAGGLAVLSGLALVTAGAAKFLLKPKVRVEVRKDSGMQFIEPAIDPAKDCGLQVNLHFDPGVQTILLAARRDHD